MTPPSIAGLPGLLSVSIGTANSPDAELYASVAQCLQAENPLKKLLEPAYRSAASILPVARKLKTACKNRGRCLPRIWITPCQSTAYGNKPQIDPTNYRMQKSLAVL